MLWVGVWDANIFFLNFETISEAQESASTQATNVVAEGQKGIHITEVRLGDARFKLL